MPARAERIYIYPREINVPGKVVRFPIWWNRRSFFKTYRDREVDTGNPFYVDYGFLLTPGEALAWNKKAWEKFSDDPRQPQAASENEQLEAKLKASKWVIVESYEWESGLE